MIAPPFDILPDSCLTHRTVRAGDTLFREGEPTKGLFQSIDAVVHLIRTGPDGEAITLYRAGPGSAFAEASIFADAYHCDALVRRSGQVVSVPKVVILRHLADPVFATAFTRTLARQIQSHRQVLEIVSIKSANERVYSAVVAGLLDGSVMDFASKIALTHEATYRALRRLVQGGRIVNPSRGIYHLKKGPDCP